MNPLPPIHPKPTYVERHYKNIKQATKHSLIHPIKSVSLYQKLSQSLFLHLHISASCPGTSKDSKKPLNMIAFCGFVQATKSLSFALRKRKWSHRTPSFKNGWEILMSGLPSSKHHGVGFFRLSYFTFTC